jgi:hypothetical protein
MRTMKTQKIAWVYGGEHGFWTSREQRFDIAPEFVGGVTAAWYRLTDNLTHTSDILYTVAAAKKAANRIINK